MKDPFYLPSALLIYLIVTGLLHLTAHAKAVKGSGTLSFGPTETVRVLIILIVLGFAGAAVYVSIVPPVSLLGAIVFGLISVTGTLAFPAEVLTGDTGVSEVKWWGTRTDIPWNQIRQIEYHKGSATTVVLSKSGSKVIHSGWNRDTEQFLKVCERRTGLSVKTTVT